jgi:hypothetical protein
MILNRLHTKRVNESRVIDQQNKGGIVNLVWESSTGIIVDKYPRATCEHGNHVHICVYSNSAVDEIKQRNMVNAGVGGTKDRNPRSGWIGVLL